MKVVKYEWSDGARFQAGAPKDADIVGRHIDLLRKEQKGELTAEDVLKDARNPNSPLHGFFEWDDSAAAEQYRLKQARGLIRSVVAVYVSDDRPAVRTRAYVHVPEAGAQHYRSTDDAMSKRKTRELVLRRALEELRQWRQRYKDLKELADLFEQIEETERRLRDAKEAA